MINLDLSVAEETALTGTKDPFFRRVVVSATCYTQTGTKVAVPGRYHHEALIEMVIFCFENE